MTATRQTEFHGGPRAALAVRPFRWWFLGQAPELRERVMGAWSVALPGTLPITALIADALADSLSTRVAYAAAGAIIAAVGLSCWRAFREPVHSG